MPLLRGLVRRAGRRREEHRRSGGARAMGAPPSIYGAHAPAGAHPIPTHHPQVLRDVHGCGPQGQVRQAGVRVDVQQRGADPVRLHVLRRALLAVSRQRVPASRVRGVDPVQARAEGHPALGLLPAHGPLPSARWVHGLSDDQYDEPRWSRTPGGQKVLHRPGAARDPGALQGQAAGRAHHLPLQDFHPIRARGQPGPVRRWPV